jgi:hypothetical protein
MEFASGVLQVKFCSSHGSAVIKALCYKPQGRGSRPDELTFFFSIYLIFPAATFLDKQPTSTEDRSNLKLNSMARVRERTIPSDRLLSAKLVPIFANRGCHMANVTDPYCRILGFLDRSHYSSSSLALTRLSGSRSRPTTSQKIW